MRIVSLSLLDGKNSFEVFKVVDLPVPSLVKGGEGRAVA